MDQLIIGLFSPFILLAFILIAFCMILGVSPEIVLKPFFGLVATVVLGLINLFILGLKLTIQGCAQNYTPLEPYEIPRTRTSKHQNHSNDEPEIRIVQSDN